MTSIEKISKKCSRVFDAETERRLCGADVASNGVGENLPNAAFLAAARRQWGSRNRQPAASAIAGTGRAAAVEPLASTPAVPCAAVAAGPGGGRGQNCRAARCDHGGREGSADYRCARPPAALPAPYVLLRGSRAGRSVLRRDSGGCFSGVRQTSSSPPTATAQRRCSWRSTGGCLTSHTM
jgi:hypothetical protein